MATTTSEPVYNIFKDVKYFTIERELIANYRNRVRSRGEGNGEGDSDDEDYGEADIYEICNDLYRQELMVVLGMPELPAMVDYSFAASDSFDSYWNNVDLICGRLYETEESFRKMIDRAIHHYSGGEDVCRASSFYYQLFSYHTFHLVHRLIQLVFDPSLVGLVELAEEKQRTIVELEKTFNHMMHIE